jgi:hypothetical protein
MNSFGFGGNLSIHKTKFKRFGLDNCTIFRQMCTKKNPENFSSCDSKIVIVIKKIVLGTNFQNVINIFNTALFLKSFSEIIKKKHFIFPCRAFNFCADIELRS